MASMVWALGSEHSGMKAVILAGGLGTRLAEETVGPKPMIEIGRKPILWHIMTYAAHGVGEFIICLGYQGYLIKSTASFFLHHCDVTIDLVQSSEVHQSSVGMARDAGHTATHHDGWPTQRIASYLGDDQTFCLTYGDGVADIDITDLIAFHQAEGRKATVTAVQPPGRFGAVRLEGNRVVSFREKPAGDEAWINGGFFVLSRHVLDYISGDDTLWEREPMERLAAESQLSAYRHPGFWHPMDTLRDKQYLERLSGPQAPWKVW
jgi:glucose-1-phosphate cytidylyltransferase